jgi:hypothetical protein
LPCTFALQRGDTAPKLGLQFRHEGTGGGNHLLRIHVRSSWRDRPKCPQLAGIEDRDRRKVPEVEVREHIVPQIQQFARPQRRDVTP